MPNPGSDCDVSALPITRHYQATAPRPHWHENRVPRRQIHFLVLNITEGTEKTPHDTKNWSL